VTLTLPQFQTQRDTVLWMGAAISEANRATGTGTGTVLFITYTYNMSQGQGVLKLIREKKNRHVEMMLK